MKEKLESKVLTMSNALSHVLSHDVYVCRIHGMAGIPHMIKVCGLWKMLHGVCRKVGGR